jgi:ABC-type branched-chain amino acid transport systems, periplasmic component
MSKSGLVMISGNNSASYLTSNRGRKASKWQAGYFRTAPNEESAGPAAARHAFNMGLRKAALINDGEIYTKGLTSGFQEEFTRIGGSIVLDASITPSDPNMGPVLSAVRNAGAELVFFPLFQPDGNNLLLQARSTSGFENVVLMSDGSLIDASFLSAVGTPPRACISWGPLRRQNSRRRPPGLNTRTRFGSKPPTIYYVSAFDAAGILFDALEKTAKPLADGTLRVGRQALREAMYATRDFKGVSSPMTCNELGLRAQASMSCAWMSPLWA